MEIDSIQRLIASSLEALSTGGSDLKLEVSGAAGQLLVMLGELRFEFIGHGRADLLALERLADALPRSVERHRLEKMHRAAGEDQMQPWSVYTTTTTLAWLTHHGMVGNVEASGDASSIILDAAETDGDISLNVSVGSDVTPPLGGTLRRRQLRANIRLAPTVKYRSIGATIWSSDIIPATLANASIGRDVTGLVDVPWLRHAGVTVADASSDSTGTLIVIREALVPLMPIPTRALRAAPRDGPPHAPWMVATAEQAALDEIDMRGHRAG